MTLGTSQNAAAMQQANDSVATMQPYGKSAIRTNLLYWATLTPNLGFDARVSERWSLGLNVGLNPFTIRESRDRKWKHLLIAPELRHWNDTVFKPRTSYWGLNLIYSHYNVSNTYFPFGLYKSVRHQRLQGDLAAIGAFYGYTWRLSKWLRLEAELGLGVGYAWAREYDCGHCGEYRGHDNKPFLVPKLALNLVFDKKKAVVPATPVVTVLPPDEPQQTDFGRKQEPTFLYAPVQPSTVSDVLMADNPVLCDYKDYRPYDNTRVMRRDSNALFVHFPLDKTVLRRDFRDNADVLDRIVSITRQIMADSMSRVRLIQIIGFASIEGSVAHNMQLGQGRAEALRNYVQQQVEGCPDDLFELNNGVEAWTELRDQLEEVLANGSGPLSREQLQDALDIIGQEQNLDRREQRLRRLNGGRTFRYIKDELLPDQRNSGYLRIYFDRLPDAKSETINSATTLLRQERYDEALTLLYSVREDHRAWNALGVALYMTGRHDEALDYFLRAAANGNTDAKNNIKLLSK